MFTYFVPENNEQHIWVLYIPKKNKYLLFIEIVCIKDILAWIYFVLFP